MPDRSSQSARIAAPAATDMRPGLCRQPLEPPPRVIRAESGPAEASGQAVPPTTRTSPTTAWAPGQPSQRPTGNELLSTPHSPLPGPKPGPVSRSEAGSSCNPTDGRRRRLRVRMASSRRRRPAVPTWNSWRTISSPRRLAAGRWSARTSGTSGPQRGSHGRWPAATERSTDIRLRGN
jgi:hypothetical protein